MKTSSDRMSRRVWLPLLAIVAALAGVAGSAAAAPPLQQGGALKDPFFSYDRPADYPTVVLERDIQVPLRDGSHLSCDLRKPGTAAGAVAIGRFPGLVSEFTAYAVTRRAAAPDYFVQRGYNVLICDARGSGSSPGELDPFSPQEQTDNYDLIEWLATQPFSTGKVAQYGVSYGGHTSLLAAVNQPPHLTTIVPVMGIHDWYENTIYRGGIESPSIYSWELALAPTLAAAGTNPTAAISMPQNTFLAYKAHPLYDEFWKARSVAARWDKLTIPVLEFGGWYDRYRDGMTKNQMARPGNVWLVMGPWTHGATQAAAQQPVGDGAYLAWFDRWLQGRQSAPLPRAKVTSHETAVDPADETGWYQFAQWPPSQTRGRRMHLTSTKALAEAAGEQGSHAYEVDPLDPGNDASHSTAVNQGDQREEDQRRLTYDTAPLAEDTVLAGAIQADLRVKLSADDGNLVVRLMDVAPDGTSLRVSAGWLKVSHREGHDHLAPVEPGQVYEVPVHVWPKHHRFPQGHRIRLAISSGDYPEIDADAPPGTVTVLTGQGGSVATLPVLRGNLGVAAPGPAAAPARAAGEPSGAGAAGTSSRSGQSLPVTGASIGPALVAAGLLVSAGALRCRRRDNSGWRQPVR